MSAWAWRTASTWARARSPSPTPARLPRSGESSRRCHWRWPPRPRPGKSWASRAWTMWAIEPHPEHEGIAGAVFDSEGHRLVGTLYLARGEEPKPTALLLHGCPGLEKNLDLAVLLRDRGWNSLVFHYRGCWGSAGRYDLRTIGRDVRAAVDHLEAGGYPSVDPGRLAVVGHSLGGWAAIMAAAADRRLRAVVTCGAPAELGDIEITADALDREITRFLATTPAEFLSQRDEVASRPGPLDLVGSIAP